MLSDILIPPAVRAALVALLAAAAALLPSAAVADGATKRRAANKPTVVLVHGAWANGSSWDGVVARLQRHGYTVRVPPNRLRGLPSDTTYLASYLETVEGPIILAGHSYGGMVITGAATGNSAVRALVYVNAFIPAQGETVLQLVSAKPGSGLADPPAVFDFVPFSGPAGDDTDLYVKPSVYRPVFAADLSTKAAAVLAATQEPLAASVLQQPAGPPAWESIPSFALMGTRDRVIPPAQQVSMAERAGATVVQVKGSHLALVARPNAVAGLIEKAAAATR